MTSWTEYLRKNLDLPVLRGHRDERAIQEIADHLEDLHQEALARGCSDSEAEAYVLKWLGDPARAAAAISATEPGHLCAESSRWIEKQEHSLRVTGGAASVLADRLRDLRTGLRSLVKRPVFTGVVVLIMALGIGATTVTLSLVRSVLLSPLPFDEPDRLVAVHHTAPDEGLRDAGQCAAWHLTYEEECRSFEALAMYSGSTATITGFGDPQAAPSLATTHGLFAALRMNAVAGRAFSSKDEEPDGQPTVMLGYGYWRSRFGGDPHAVGRTLQVNGVTREIIGVVPPEIQVLGVSPDVVTPIRIQRDSLFVGNIGASAVARLREGVSLDEATADLTRVLPMAWKKFPGGPVATSTRPDHYAPVLRPLRDDLVGPVATLLWILLGGAAVVLLIACANVSNLFLVRAQGKQGEMAVRSAMGASRARLAWEYVKESLVLGVIGGAAGLGLGWIALPRLVALAPVSLPRTGEVGLDLTVVLVVLGVSVGSGVLFGWLPMLRSGGRARLDALKTGGRNRMLDRGRRRTQSILVATQVALVVVLLVAGGLLLRSLAALRDVDPGFGGPDEVLAIRLSIPRQEVSDPAEVASTYERIARRLEELPGVTAVGLATAIPMDGSLNYNPVFVEGGADDAGKVGVSRRHKWIGGGYLEAMQTPLVIGRSITWDDVHNRAPVALLSKSLARELFGSPEAALGRRIAARPDPPRWKEVVGIVADVQEDGLGQPAPGLVYWPQVTLGFWEGNPADQVQTWRAAGLALRGDEVGSQAFQDAVRRAIWEVNPNLPLMQVRRLSELAAASTARTTFCAILLGLAAAVALLLGVVGIFGVVSYSTMQRVAELGTRVALGATAPQILTLVLGQGLALTAAGVGIGLLVALGVTRLMTALLFEVSPADPLTYLTVTTGLVSVALVAAYLPARRASRVDPVVALRAE